MVLEKEWLAIVDVRFWLGAERKKGRSFLNNLSQKPKTAPILRQERFLFIPAPFPERHVLQTDKRY